MEHFIKNFLFSFLRFANVLWKRKWYRERWRLTLIVTYQPTEYTYSLYTCARQSKKTQTLTSYARMLCKYIIFWRYFARGDILFIDSIYFLVCYFVAPFHILLKVKQTSKYRADIINVRVVIIVVKRKV